MKCSSTLPCLVLAVSLICLVTLRTAWAQSASMFMFPPAPQFVRITGPPNHATFYTPVDIPIFAFAHDETYGPAEYTNVAFYYSGTNLLGKAFTNFLGDGFCLSSTNPPTRFLPLQAVMIRPEPRLLDVWGFVWTNPPAGSYWLTAVARGVQLGEVDLSRTSAPVAITILAGVTNTNPADVVSIVATDPVAIAATNACWIWEGVTNKTPSWTNWWPRPATGWGYVTNWGPKSALFTVRRFGDAATNLTVNYKIGGTASNGVDYVQLSGSVTIPAGEAYALIPVVPIDQKITNFSKTVVLSLQADTNAPPDYTVGLPARAAAMILDYWPRPLPLLLSDRSFHFNTNGPDGAWFAVQNSPDFRSWISFSTNQVIHGSIDFVDPDAPSFSRRFYRVVPLTNAPAN